MYPDIEKLINIAKESGELTEKQKEIILRKAEKLGEDVDEVEMVLESIRPNQVKKESTKVDEKKMKCPNCGAIILETSFKCPECGFVLQEENRASIEARDYIQTLQQKLVDVSNTASSRKRGLFDESWKEIYEQKLNIIQTLSMPITKEGLIQMLEFSYSNYISSSSSTQYDNDIRQAWYGKCIQAFNALQRLSTDDDRVKALLEQYSTSIKNEKKKISSDNKTMLSFVLIIVLMVFIAYLLGYI